MLVGYAHSAQSRFITPRYSTAFLLLHCATKPRCSRVLRCCAHTTATTATRPAVCAAVALGLGPVASHPTAAIASCARRSSPISTWPGASSCVTRSLAAAGVASSGARTSSSPSPSSSPRGGMELGGSALRAFPATFLGPQAQQQQEEGKEHGGSAAAPLTRGSLALTAGGGGEGAVLSPAPALPATPVGGSQAAIEGDQKQQAQQQPSKRCRKEAAATTTAAGRRLGSDGSADAGGGSAGTPISDGASGGSNAALTTPPAGADGDGVGVRVQAAQTRRGGGRATSKSKRQSQQPSVHEALASATTAEAFESILAPVGRRTSARLRSTAVAATQVAANTAAAAVVLAAAATVGTGSGGGGGGGGALTSGRIPAAATVETESLRYAAAMAREEELPPAPTPGGGKRARAPGIGAAPSAAAGSLAKRAATRVLAQVATVTGMGGGGCGGDSTGSGPEHNGQEEEERQVATVTVRRTRKAPKRQRTTAAASTATAANPAAAANVVTKEGPEEDKEEEEETLEVVVVKQKKVRRTKAAVNEEVRQDASRGVFAVTSTLHERYPHSREYGPGAVALPAAALTVAREANVRLAAAAVAALPSRSSGGSEVDGGGAAAASARGSGGSVSKSSGRSAAMDQCQDAVAVAAEVAEEKEEKEEEEEEPQGRGKGKKRVAAKPKADPPVPALVHPMPDHIPNLGYACLCATLRAKDVFASRDTNKAGFNGKGLPHVSRLALANARDLRPLIEWNEAHGIRLFRLSSGIFPWMSFYVLEDLPDSETIKQALADAGDAARRYGHRLTFHPSEFTKVASDKPEVVETSVKELEVHSHILDLMGFVPATVFNKINIHVGGVYGNKIASMDRFAEVVLERLSPNCRARLTVENDDRASMYSVQDLTYLSAKARIPIVFDFHHHRFCTGGLSEEEAFRLALTTWPPGVRPVVHWSESQEGRRPHAHSDYVTGPIYLYGMEKEVDVMIESKAKELALLHYRQAALAGRAAQRPALGGEEAEALAAGDG